MSALVITLYFEPFVVVSVSEMQYDNAKPALLINRPTLVLFINMG